MSRLLARGHVCSVRRTLWVLASLVYVLPAAAEPHATLELVIVGVTQSCLSAEPLRARVLHYAGRASAHRGLDGLRVEIRLSGDAGAELLLSRADRVLARRRFEQLPGRCAERRDTLALSIALAAEHVAGVEGVGAGGSVTPLGSAVRPVVAGDESSGAEGDGLSRERAARAVAVDAVHDEPGSSKRDGLSRDGIVRPVAGREVHDVGAEPRDAGGAPPSAAVERAADFVAWRAFAGARWLVQAFPDGVFAGSLGVEVQRGGFSVAFAGLVGPVASFGLAGHRARISWAGAELLGCRVGGLAGFGIQGCLGMGGAAFSAVGEGYATSVRAPLRAWAAALGRVALRWPEASVLALRLSVQGHVNLARPIVAVEGTTARLEVGMLGGSAGLDVLVELP